MTTAYCLVSTNLCLSAEAWAAWMQALFTIVALAIAIAVPARQHRQTTRKERERETAEALRLLNITSELVFRTVHLVVTIRTLRGNPQATETETQRGEQERAALQLEQALRSAPLYLLPSANAAMQVIQALGAISEARLLIPWQPRNMSDEIVCGEAYGRPWANIVGSLGQAHAELDAEVRKLKKDGPRV